MFRLKKPDGTTYTVARAGLGDDHRCDCGAATFRRAAGPCKHTLALKAVGLI